MDLASYTIKDENDSFAPYQDQHGDTEYESGPKLDSPVTYLRTVEYYMNGLEDKTIDANPEYQREVVWTADRMSGLIESLMENYYIPPIILNRQAMNTENESKPRYVCIDGKQRLSSIKRFVEGVIPITDKRGDAWYFINAEPDNLGKRRIFSEQKRREFLRKEFVSVEYTNLTADQEEELFSRVQMGVPLTIAERLRASRGPWQELAMCYVKDFPSIYKLIKDVTRARDFQLTLSCFSQILEIRDALETGRTPALKTMHNNVPKLLENREAVSDTTKAHLAHVWNVFEELINLDPITFNTEKHFTKLSPFSQFEIIAITVMISLFSETRSYQVLLEYVQKIRAKHFEKIGSKHQTWNNFWVWVNQLEAPVSNGRIQEDVRETTSPIYSGLVHGESSSSRLRNDSCADASSAERPSLKKRRIERRIEQRKEHKPGRIKNTSRSPNISQLKLPVRETSTSSPLPPAQNARKSTSTNSPQSQPKPKPRVPSTSSLPPTPSEVRQNRISELDSYRAPVAPMGAVAPFAIIGTPSSRPPPPPRSKSASNATVAPSLVNATVKKVPIPVSSPKKKKAHPTGSKRPAPVLPQVDGVIDFTGDSDEEEEQAAHELLTSHKPSVLADRQPPAAAVVEKIAGGEKQLRGFKDSVAVELGNDFGLKQRRLREQTHSLY
ncbi:hypothetical protein DM02DRAFT_667992 [Periconia macrospinosa]|uniref:GmrSD restriction endonucleases N-terminal domain-containing protein n=1 Tax=Periconia macrospinosa TaxID=97972 RepID=A0A2V1E6N6_9PLEO|nr:hypothetical protein DM02DRAFT_667992 [Periconia macrospinosa]